jgi:hypothetical protein
MERRHFKLTLGYLNIDDAALSFSRSGNWKEVEGLKERSGYGGLSRTARVLIGIILVVLGGGFLDLIDLFRDSRADNVVFSLACGGLGLYSMFLKIADDMAPSYRIPFAKVLQLTYHGDTLEVRFLDARFKEDRVQVQLAPEAAQFAEAQWQASRTDQPLTRS